MSTMDTLYTVREARITKSSYPSNIPLHSIPLLPIYLINQLPPIPHPPQILPQYLKSPLSIHSRRPTNVWRNQAIRRIPQRIIFRQRLRICNIEGGAADLLGLESLDESCLVDDLAAGDVGYEGTRWVAGVEELEFWGGEEVGCFLAGRVLVREGYVSQDGTGWPRWWY